MAEQARQWHLYILQLASGQLYTGITTDVERRFAEHQSGSARAAKSLRGKGPLQLVFTCRAGDQSQALRLEARVKKLSRAEKLKVVQQKCLPGDLTA
ncbi:GIY-YIG nuclease family protein [Marinospirillum sp.]|uniref:GIY-YIG nuclease family protein n=1 Tax=Marinospirillum sp. TaxID=2183934 RepID=UPI0028708B66|nr:GIY-YIG nuclease family protein [Marinospirillum sp.]MDR9467491.1 GIY-YIG nuclease family protein [Marinospirillum sp.]